MLKLSTLTLALTAAYVFLPGKAGFTQTPAPVNNSRPETPYCYMQTQAGSTLDLSKLCASNTPIPNRRIYTPPIPNRRIYTPPIPNRNINTGGAAASSASGFSRRGGMNCVTTASSASASSSVSRGGVTSSTSAASSSSAYSCVGN